MPSNLLRTAATLLIAATLASCGSPGRTTQPLDLPETGALNILPTPTPEQTAATTPAPVMSDVAWTQTDFGSGWNIGYPATWSVNDAGAGEGALQLSGEYGGHTYVATYSYPLGIAAATLDAWVDEVLLPLDLAAREAVEVSDITVGGSAAKKVLNVPAQDGAGLSHQVYIWRDGAANPRLITITQDDDSTFDADAMEQLLDQLVASVQ